VQGTAAPEPSVGSSVRPEVVTSAAEMLAGRPQVHDAGCMDSSVPTRCVTSLHMTHCDATVQYVGPAAARIRARDQLDAALDDMRAHGQLLFGVYDILSSLERRGGGQGCVQFVHDRDTRRDLAVKFFFKLDAFEREAGLYADPVLRAMMAATLHISANADGVLVSASGYAFPPHIVIERGEPLDEWIRRMIQRTASGALPLVAVFQALINIADRLVLLHRAGYVHCDLKPSNVLWLADMHAWTLIDFGATCKAGKTFEWDHYMFTKIARHLGTPIHNAKSRRDPAYLIAQALDTLHVTHKVQCVHSVRDNVAPHLGSDCNCQGAKIADTCRLHTCSSRHSSQG
jgi:hypothetical protein